MWARLIFGGCAAVALTCAAAVPSFATRPAANNLAYEENFGHGHAALFGSHEVYSQSTWRFAQWTEMLARSAVETKDAQHLCTTQTETQCTPPEWQALLDRMRGLDLRQQIDIANDAMNRHPYVPTMQNWHRSMYWETAFEFLRRGGQCQDYAIAKYLLLRAAGVPAELMRMVVLRDAAIGLDHAILAVYVDGEPLLLDNLRADIVPAAGVGYYHPYYSINETGWWFHFGGQSMTRVAANYR
ncbi:MAG TPA: transglutaminase-like cysteine peptidase [Stellaceae bacterium]|jgi:predicted transglutaminase-like cysteine proteinase|nr:transglutaminase-like cysteine peptidase [Stellaceae bacterium]